MPAGFIAGIHPEIPTKIHSQIPAEISLGIHSIFPIEIGAGIPSKNHTVIRQAVLAENPPGIHLKSSYMFCIEILAEICFRVSAGIPLEILAGFPPVGVHQSISAENPQGTPPAIHPGIPSYIFPGTFHINAKILPGIPLMMIQLFRLGFHKEFLRKLLLRTLQ